MKNKYWPLSLRDKATRHEPRRALRGSPSHLSLGQTGKYLGFFLILIFLLTSFNVAQAEIIGIQNEEKSKNSSN